MTPAKIRRRRETINRHQLKWKKAEVDLMNQCSHSDANKKYRSNTGNYGPSADSYWIDYDCPDCGKKWWESQ